ncbi:MAG: nitronate monooxygenase [Gaiellaceae bacterium]|nr:nitronate monooxygenase [Gaiellaceae bacterium]
MDPLRTPLCHLVGIRHAILLAGMAGGPNTPELVGAVSRAGGLGVLGVTGTTVEATVTATRAALALADGAPVGVNVQLAPRTAPTGDRERIAAVLAPFRAELGLPPEPPAPAPAGSPAELAAASVAAGASVITTFEDPTPVIGIAREAGVPVLAMVTSPAEARIAVGAGADAVIAQGSEAGGHRSAFAAGEGVRSVPEIGTLALVPLIVDAVGDAVPVIASGGIMDGRGIAAALALGASGVSLGTRFLGARESGVADVYRQTLADAERYGTVVTDAVTGRPARWINNRIVAALVAADAGTLGWGAQAAFTADLRKEAARQNAAELLPMLAGQGAALVGEPLPAADIVALLVSQTRAALQR